MKETKHRMELFSLYDRTGMEAHLANMAEKGWLLEKIGQFLWSYRRIEPKHLTFSVCYFPKASQFDPGPSEDQETFYDFCAHTGWVLAASSAQLQVFYNERPDPVPIETDPVQEVETVHRAMKKSYLPAQFMLLVIGLLNGGMFVSGLKRDFIGTLASPSLFFSCLCWVLVLLLSVTEITAYFRWHRKSVRAAEQGEFYKTRSRRGLQSAALLLLVVGLVWYLLNIFTAGSRMMMVLVLLMFLIYVPGVFLLVNGIKGFLKKRGVSAGVNRVAIFGGSIVLAFLLAGGITAFTLYGSFHGWFDEGGETYQWKGHTFTADSHHLPLSAEELTGDLREGYSKEVRGEESLLLGQYTYRQRPRFDTEGRESMYWLDYQVVVVKAPFLYEMCKEQMLHAYDYWNQDEPEENWSFYEPVNPDPWGAAAAWRWETSYGHGSRFLLCYGDRIVEIDLTLPYGDWTPTAEQMALVGERLGGSRP